MDGLQQLLRKASRDYQSASRSLSESGGGGGGGGGVSALSSEQSGVLVTRAPRQAVSLWTCSKLCAVFFVAGVVVGYTLKRRVRRWASKLLRRLKDD
ncbi:uncharacterized protein LOC100256162 [Vitis vinifera]|uniref:Uncharacterized protein n=1 Tax=Vitis vinifera TaxID=29760 RepID=F6HGM3_VITVI|nr:uncharacterized protein LOC100256162 [Vitis vinifera]|eukprot:XP_002275889.1 PREDICTED: uncharacterized protein LOC100256162 [Vitis vinifera]